MLITECNLGSEAVAFANTSKTHTHTKKSEQLKSWLEKAGLRKCQVHIRRVCVYVCVWEEGVGG